MMSDQMTFDVPLNPTAPAEEEGRLNRQAKAILELFLSAQEAGHPVRTSDLMKIAGPYNARLFEVRRHLLVHNLCIDLTERDSATGNNVYRLVPLCESTFYPKHKERLLCWR